MLIKTFNQLSKKDVAVAGGKGASLGEMTLRLCSGRASAKCPVPPGFVVLANAFEEFLAESDLAAEVEAKLKQVNFKDINSVDRASNEIRDLILDAEFPVKLGQEILKEFAKLKAKFVAVRSSATAEDSSVASWAGELETYLNTVRATLLENIKKCWASLFTPRAIFYRFEKKMDKTKVSVAVVVQAMIQSEVSGICFTVHPVTKDRNQIVIEAGWGLGEAIVGGKITPDTYIINKSQIPNFKLQTNPKSQIKKLILDKNISEQEMMIVRKGGSGIEEIKVLGVKQGKQKLLDRQIFALAKICLSIENHYGTPQDIEWALERGKIYITQSRPITTL